LNSQVLPQGTTTVALHSFSPSAVSNGAASKSHVPSSGQLPTSLCVCPGSSYITSGPKSHNSHNAVCEVNNSAGLGFTEIQNPKNMRVAELDGRATHVFRETEHHFNGLGCRRGLKAKRCIACQDCAAELFRTQFQSVPIGPRSSRRR
jgi:hypothetical protein